MGSASIANPTTNFATTVSTTNTSLFTTMNDNTKAASYSDDGWSGTPSYSNSGAFTEPSDGSGYPSGSGWVRNTVYAEPFTGYEQITTQRENWSILAEAVSGVPTGVEPPRTSYPSGPYVDLNSPDIDLSSVNLFVLPNWNDLKVALLRIALEECGGTLTLQTKVGTTPAIDPFTYQKTAIWDYTGAPLESDMTVVKTTKQFTSGTFVVTTSDGHSRTIEIQPQNLSDVSAYNPGVWKCRAGVTNRPFTLVDIPDSQWKGIKVVVGPNGGGLVHADGDLAMMTFLDRLRSRAQTRAGRQAPGADDGAALILVLVLILVSALLVLPLLDYAMAVTKASSIVDNKAQRVEATKGALRVAMADLVNLYKACEGTGPNSGQVLADPQTKIAVRTTCYLMRQNVAEDEDKRPYGVAATQAGTVLPAYFADKGNVYTDSGNADANLWRTKTSLPRLRDTIWYPNLPAHALSPRSPTPYDMPIEFGECQVYFPGTYDQPMVINGTKPTYFASGIYYFENTVDGHRKGHHRRWRRCGRRLHHRSGGRVLRGECPDDAQHHRPRGHLRVRHERPAWSSTTRRSVRATINAHLQPALRALRTMSATSRRRAVNIISVNGELPGDLVTNTLSDLVIANVISVPGSLAPGVDGSLAPANQNSYRPSKLIPPDPAPSPLRWRRRRSSTSTFTTNSAVNIELPGYVRCPRAASR